MADFVFSDWYFAHYDKLRNYIMIHLPPTFETVNDTVSRIADRKTEISAEELGLLLNFVKLIFQKEK